MKKILRNIRALAALLMAGAAFAACSSNDDNIIEQQPANLGEQVYTLTINASKGDAATRALSLSGTSLVASWANGDELTVYNITQDAPLGGTLTASNASGAIATFKGALTGSIDAGDGLKLSYHPTASLSAFASQDGTLSGTNGAENYDQATATVTVKTVDGSGNITTTTDASFTTSTAMIKLTLTSDGTTPINATSLSVKSTLTVGSATITEDVITFSPTDATYTTNGKDGVLYFALPNKDDLATILAAKYGADPYSLPVTPTSVSTLLASAPITFTASDGTDTYAVTKTGYPFAGGSYYASTLTMTKHLDLSTVTVDRTVTDGYTLTGTLGSNVKISIADGATVTLNGVSINADRAWTNGNNAGITCIGDATIILADGSTNNVNGLNNKYPGIYVPGDPANSSNNKTLTIKGNGTLNASTILGVNDSGAGIGGSGNSHCGNIRIESGTINATGGSGATGIGGGWNTSCGDITITGGSITAVGGIYAAGIGSGAGTGGTSGVCGNILITGGTIDATGGNASAGIGGGKVCGDITITGTNITARKGSGAPYSIGAGNNASCGTVTVNYVEGSISTSPYTTSFIDLSAAGNANTYIVSSTGIYKFDATVKGNGGLDPLTGTTATKINKSSIAGVKVLWEVYDKGRAIKHDGTKYAISYNDGYVYFSTPDVFAEGDCYVAVYDAEDKILWSWLIWATATPSEQIVGSDKFMNCNLGSIQVAYCTHGFLYEWGRKDPFPSTKYNNYDPYDYYPARMTCHSLVNSSQSVSYTIENPTTYIYNTAWVTDADYKTNLWSDTEKTIYDPCPAGWRTPTSTQMSSFHSSVGLGTLPSTGFIGNCSGGDFGYGNPSTGYYWSSTGVNRSNAMASCNDGRLNNNWPVNEGYAIRPVKE